MNEEEEEKILRDSHDWYKQQLERQITNQTLQKLDLEDQIYEAKKNTDLSLLLSWLAILASFTSLIIGYYR